MASKDDFPERGDLGGWGVRGQFDTDESPREDPRYENFAYAPEAYTRVYVSDEIGWKTIYGGIPLDYEDGYDIWDAIEDLEDFYGTSGG